MSIYNEYEFDVVSVHDGTVLPQFQSGSVTAARAFKVPCRYAEEFALRMIGKFWDPMNNYEDPRLPASYPWDDDPPVYRQQSTLRLVATGFDIKPVSPACFTSIHFIGEGEEETSNAVTDPESFLQMERYYAVDEMVDRLPVDSECCDCIVQIQYSAPKWDCTFNEIEEITVNTAIRVRRKPGYEMFTLPNRSLVWDSLPDGPDKALKGDANAAILIPRADITVDWYNIPVRSLCAVGQHLDTFRNTVNNASFGAFLECESYTEGSGSAASCNVYEAETLLFVDWAEIEDERTSGFRYMDSTAIRINLKQKRIVEPSDNSIKGWNHFFFDRTRGDTPTGRWERVKVQNVGSTEDLFILKDWSSLLDPTL